MKLFWNRAIGLGGDVVYLFIFIFYLFIYFFIYTSGPVVLEMMLFEANCWRRTTDDGRRTQGDQYSSSRARCAQVSFFIKSIHIDKD